MLIECPECKNAVSDQAPACPHCGFVIGAQKVNPIKLSAKRRLQQWTWFFFWLFVAGMGWSVFKEPDMSRVPGQVMVAIGFFGWIIVMIRRWLNT